MSLGKHLIGAPPWRSLPQGVVVYGEKDPSDGVTYYWEEWEVLGYENLDFWVEYDHDTKAVTLYRPAESEEALDPTRMRKGQTVTVTVAGTKHRAVVSEVGVGTIASLDGSFTYDLTVGQRVAYAELRANRTVFSLEKFDDRIIDLYHGTVLDSEGQKAHFGKRVAPRDVKVNPVVAFVLILAAGIGLFSACGDRDVDDDDCTPRTVEQQYDASGDLVPTENDTCYRRSVYGGGGGGLGK
ncbi:hypothetical protein ACFVQ3_14995 [Oerskovia sp. NPDC057915]|uniref:hypothetical protein n=1 Tax=Oerskovia sp. NPDC057915 TaxID=3346280 RepID=UPI0036D8434D